MRWAAASLGHGRPVGVGWLSAIVIPVTKVDTGGGRGREVVLRSVVVETASLSYTASSGFPQFWPNAEWPLSSSGLRREPARLRRSTPVRSARDRAAPAGAHSASRLTPLQGTTVTPGRGLAKDAGSPT